MLDRSKLMKEKWQNLNYRKNMQESHKTESYKLKYKQIQDELMAQPEYRQKLKDAAVKKWTNPDYRNKVINSLTGREMESPEPETIKKMSAASKKRWSYPGYRENISQKCSIAKKRLWQTDYRTKVMTTKSTPEFKLRYSENQKKSWNKPNKRENASKYTRGRWANPVVRKLMIDGIKKAFSSQDYREKRKEKSLEMWKRPEYRTKMASSMIHNYHSTPNKSEQRLMNILSHNFPPEQWQYVGSGSEIIGGKNPDFINKEAKAIIEYNGVFWHTKRKGMTKEAEEAQRIAHFAQHGYRTLVIWGSEIDDEAAIVARVKAFQNQNS
jgi:G:T-mismatch repair DNA endonuclease (very short patch repair protein)